MVASSAFIPSYHRAKLRATLSQHGEAVLRDNLALKAGWIIGGIGVISFGAAVFLLVTLLPRLTHVEPPQFLLVDTTSGWMGPAMAAANAPGLFKDPHDHEYLGRYLDACEGWVPRD